MYISPNNGPVDCISGYMEGNGRSSLNISGLQYAIWFSGRTSAASLHTVFQGTHLGLTPAIRLCDTAPSRAEGGVKFIDFRFLGTVNADWDNYREIDCDRSVVHSNVYPTMFTHQYNTFRGLGVSGKGRFTGAVASSAFEGVITGATKNGTGDFTLTQAHESYSGGHQQYYFTPLPSGWTIEFTAKTNNSYRFLLKNAGVATDPSFELGFFCMGDYA
jgi:hypothetical protein